MGQRAVFQVSLESTWRLLGASGDLRHRNCREGPRTRTLSTRIQTRIQFRFAWTLPCWRGFSSAERPVPAAHGRQWPRWAIRQGLDKLADDLYHHCKISSGSRSARFYRSGRV